MPSYKNIGESLLDLEKEGQLIRIKEEVDPHLEIAAIQRRIYQNNGPAVLFENVKGTKYPCVANLFGSLERCHFIFRKTLRSVNKIIQIQADPSSLFKHPFQNTSVALAGFNALPKKVSTNHIQDFEEISVHQLPQIKCWEKDGGAFITLPQVYSENMDKLGAMHGNLGMYRVQLSGNQYIEDQEIGIHYQIHRGIGINQQIALNKKLPLKVSIFVGGPPAHTVAAVMPLPEDMSELMFAGLLAGRRFRYFMQEGHLISADADFVITGYLLSDVKPEGPFGDHFGYYSLTHDFPVLKVHKVYAKKDAIWPFTVVGRPPQEDTSFGVLIHEMTGSAISQQVPGVRQVHAVDAAGVHPLLLAIGSERYTPYLKENRPSELLTQANRILGTGQLSLAKYLFITAEGEQVPSIQETQSFIQYILERIDFKRDIHFQTCTTIDTLDYSGSSLNEGSKVIFAATNPVKRNLCSNIPASFTAIFPNSKMIAHGIVAIATSPFSNYASSEIDVTQWCDQIATQDHSGIALIVICDDADFMAQNWDIFLWVTFTRSDPARDIYGVNSFTKDKHWGCNGPLIIDARTKPHHAPVLEETPAVLKKIEHFFEKDGPLFGF